MSYRGFWRISGGTVAGGIVLILGVVLLLNNLLPSLQIWRFIANLWPAVLIILGIYMIFGHGRFRGYGDVYGRFSESRFIGDMRLEFDGKEIAEINASHLIGDLSIDLTGARLKPGVNRLNASLVIGDATILVPAQFPLRLSARMLLGDVKFGRRREGGILPQIEHVDDNYESSESKLAITASGVIGDLTLQKVAM